MDVVSNQVITEAEFSRWTKTLQQEGIPLPSKSEIDELKSKLDRANDFRSEQHFEIHLSRIV
jgi:hypothetical protein